MIININSMEIESSDDCRFDALEISWEGGHHTMCGYIQDGDTCSFVAEAGPIRVIFRSDYSVTRPGFSLSYTVAEPGTQATCFDSPTDNFVNIDDFGPSPTPFPISTTREPCGGILTSQNGTIVSPNYPNHYDDYSNCNWVINVTQPAVR